MEAAEIFAGIEGVDGIEEDKVCLGIKVHFIIHLLLLLVLLMALHFLPLPPSLSLPSVPVLCGW